MRDARLHWLRKVAIRRHDAGLGWLNHFEMAPIAFNVLGTRIRSNAPIGPVALIARRHQGSKSVANKTMSSATQ